MKRTLLFIIVAMILLPASVSVQAQSRKEERRARKELRRQERAIRDSLLLMMAENDSINVGYGYTKKRNLTTSVSSVKAKNTETDGYTHVAEYLQGRVPGLSVRKVGASYKFVIRGINSINSSTDPLLIVDGHTVSDIDYLNPKDIKSVEVLKDASASIYGSRGACGVILITTK